MTSGGSTPETDAEARAAGVAWWYWLALVLGWAVIANGLRGVLADVGATPPVRLGIWVVGLALLHDAVVAPVAYLAGWAIGRLAPRTWALPVQLGVAASALAVAYTWPYLRGYGRLTTNPSVLPLAYGRNLGIAVSVIWVATIVWGTRRHARARSGSTSTAGPAPDQVPGDPA